MSSVQPLAPQTRSKAEILRRLRTYSVPDAPLPDPIDGPWITYPDRIAQLASAVQGVGGECKCVADIAAVHEDLLSYPEYQAAELCWSNLPGIPGNVDLSAVDRPHDLERVDFTIYRGTLAVAENGAVFVSDVDVPHRVIFFIAQHLILLVDRCDVVDTMHDAYRKIELGGRGFDCFISGPSKTADIEQSLVIGAHGCRSMQLYILG